MDAIGFDPLTGFLDRGGCLRAAVRLAEFCRRQGRPFAVLWADLDLAAMNIFRSLKDAIPQLRMSAIYEEMAKTYGW